MRTAWCIYYYFYCHFHMKSEAVVASLTNRDFWILKICLNENTIQEEYQIRKVKPGKLKIKSNLLPDKERQSSYQDPTVNQTRKGGWIFYRLSFISKWEKGRGLSIQSSKADPTSIVSCTKWKLGVPAKWVLGVSGSCRNARAPAWCRIWPTACRQDPGSHCSSCGRNYSLMLKH